MRCKPRVKYLLPWSILHNLNTCSPMWKRKGSNSLRNSGETIYVDWTERLVSCFVGWATCKPYFSQYRHLWCFAEKSGDILFFQENHIAINVADWWARVSRQPIRWWIDLLFVSYDIYKPRYIHPRQVEGLAY